MYKRQGGIRSSLGEAAENLGASPVSSFFQITLPLSVPVISRAFLIIFIFAFGGYELPLLLEMCIRDSRFPGASVPS